MAKINNAVRIFEFNDETEFYYQIENDLTSYMDEPDSRCYKLKNIQMLDKKHALAYFEEDLNVIMVRFFSNGEEITIQEAPDREYDIEEIKYAVDDYGVRHAEIYMN